MAVRVQVWCHDEQGLSIDGLDHKHFLFARMPVVGDRIQIEDNRYLVKEVVLWPLSVENQVAGEIDAFLESEE